ncbi:MAG: pentapeptide repeat-containing protein [Cyanobacteria bacterium P01_G01_bin.54]
MSTSPGLAVKKPIKVWNKPLQANFKDLFKALAKAGVDTATGNWLGLPKDAVDALAAVGLGSKEPAELAWALIYNALTKAVATVVSDGEFLSRAIPEDLDGLSDRLDLSLEDRELEITDHFFAHPERLSVVQDLRTPLRQWLEGFGVEPPQAEALSNRLPTYFVVELYREWREHSQDYAPIQEAVQTPFTEAVERTQGGGLYNAWLQKQIQEPMLFEAFGLADIYVPLRAYYRRQVGGDETVEEERIAPTVPGGKGSYQRVVVDLEDCLQAWLQAADKNDAIRIISGGPGSGKSSFAKIFVAHQAQKGDFPVLFVPLHQFNSSGDLVQAVAEFVRYDEYLTDNPLNPDDHNLRLLVIFDGLDELALQGKLAKEVAQDFVREVKDKVSLFNRSKTRLQVLFTGREVAVQESFRDPRQILHVLPYFVPEEDREKGNDESYQDPDQRLADDQRNDWWQKYGIATQTFHTTMPESLNQGNLTEITAQPLLNYLVALSYVQEKLTLSEQTNLNTVYADLLKAVYERGYEDNRKHAALGDLSEAHFRRVLEEIALAAWHGDGRTTTVAEIERHCESSGLKRLLEIFEEGAKAGVTRLLAAFYFRQSGAVRNQERTFEFTHKSFGEYLTACRIVRAMERIQKQLNYRQNDMEEGWDERLALLYWAEVCGSTRLDTYLLRFLRDEVALRPISQVRQWQKTFAHLIGVMLRQGLPMEKLEPPLRFQQMNQWAIHAEEALLVALNACARVTRKVSEVDWPSATAFGTWIKRLQGQRRSGENVLALWNLSYLNLEGAILRFQDFYEADLRGAYLWGVYLRGAYLQRANLRGAYLQGANLWQADLMEADLMEADLMEADLQGANLLGADLLQADLMEANLLGANLLGADLREVDLRGANLQQADLRLADLQLANLRSIRWNNETNWEGVEGLEEAHNVPEKLKQQLGLAEPE